MLNRRAILGYITTLPFFVRRRVDAFRMEGVTVPAGTRDTLEIMEEGYIATKPLRVKIVNGFEFAFTWLLEPGDTVHTRTMPGIQGVFVERRRVRPDGGITSVFAWSFHTEPLYTSVIAGGRHGLDLMAMSLRSGHEDVKPGEIKTFA